MRTGNVRVELRDQRERPVHMAGTSRETAKVASGDRHESLSNARCQSVSLAAEPA
jgi:hypothetical protein